MMVTIWYEAIMKVCCVSYRNLPMRQALNNQLAEVRAVRGPQYDRPGASGLQRHGRGVLPLVQDSRKELGRLRLGRRRQSGVENGQAGITPSHNTQDRLPLPGVRLQNAG